MYLIKYILCILNVVVIAVQGFKMFSFHNRHRRLMKIKSAAVLTGVPIHTGWITQKVDHFNTKETRTWKMRYFKRLDYWKQNGPIYLILGGESTAHPGDFTIGLVHELAKETKGALFMSEHRYYGKSQPIKQNTVAAMKFLTTSQSLADNAYLLDKIKKNPRFKHSKVVIVGGSYAGNLAAWMKLVYSNVVDAAIASSAPVLAKRDFYESLEVVNNDYKKYGTKGCLKNIRRMFHRYETLFKTTKGIRKLKKEEKICKGIDLTKPQNKYFFFSTKIDPFAGFAQNGNINDIKEHCDKINGSQYDPSDDANWSEKRNCNDYDFKNAVREFRKDKDGYRWVYQTCTEYGYFFSTTSNKQPFTHNFPVEWSEMICVALFGKSFNKARVIDGTRKINQRYGGRSPNVTKVVFVNGELDPWSSLGVLKDISPVAPAIYIRKASHCNELLPEANDPQEVKNARINIKNLIKKWIGVSTLRTYEFNFTININ